MTLDELFDASFYPAAQIENEIWRDKAGQKLLKSAGTKRARDQLLIAMALAYYLQAQAFNPGGQTQ